MFPLYCGKIIFERSNKITGMKMYSRQKASVLYMVLNIWGEIEDHGFMRCGGFEAQICYHRNLLSKSAMAAITVACIIYIPTELPSQDKDQICKLRSCSK
ncbi:hypothetical protein Hanom_Chr05g00402431 [Helianthus anomalus]